MTDRELDALVAEKVIGWKLVSFVDETNWPAHHAWWELPSGKRSSEPCPRYSTTGDGMLAVIGALHKKHMSVHTQSGPFHGNFCSISKEPEGPVAYIGGWKIAQANADSLPRAVCLAALKALGVDHE